MLVEVEDIGGKKRGFPANEGNVPLHIFMDEPPPIDGLDSVHCSEQSVGHGNTEPLWLLRTKDGHDKFDHPPLSPIPAICGVRWNPSFAS